MPDFLRPRLPTVYDCEYQCDLILQDQTAATLAYERRDEKQAKKIQAEIKEKVDRCLGTVLCNGALECGLVHGNVRKEG